MQVTVRRRTHNPSTIAQLRWVLIRLTPLQVHQEDVTVQKLRRDITVDKPSIVNMFENRLHLHGKCLVNLFIFRNDITDMFQGKELQDPPNFLEAVQCGDYLSKEIFQSCVGAGFIF